MIQYYAYLTKDNDCCVYKSINDKKKYRFLKLDNGLKVFIIQDERKSTKLDDDATTTTSTDDKCEQEIKRIRLSNENQDACSNENENLDADKLAAVALCVNVGGFQDPIELPGLAHFTEHVVLMGNEEFPGVNEFDLYLGLHSGYSNAHTESEFTVYEAQVPNSYLDGCLKRFAACFKSPLFRPEHIVSELNPVNNEFVDNFVDDDVRYFEMLTTFCKKDHVCSKFLWGNQFSLKEYPESKGVDVRKHMVEFFNKHYKASRMSLVIQSQESLDSVEKLVKSYFSTIPTEVNNDPTPEQIDEEKLIKELLDTKDPFLKKKEYPYAKDTMNNLYVMESIEDGHSLKLVYCLPPVAKLYKVKPLETLGTILGDEGPHSLTRYLIKKKLILEFITAHDDTCYCYSSPDYFSLFCLEIKLTDEGLEKIDQVVQLINYYIDLMVQHGPQEELFNEKRLISLTDIRFEDEVSSSKNTMNTSKQLFMYPLEYVLIGPKLLYEFNRDTVKYCLDFIKTQPRLAIIQSKKVFKSSNWPVQTTFFSKIDYKIEPLPEQWKQSAIETDELKASLKLPARNEFISSDFDLKPQECYYDNPILIDQDSHYRCYFKNDKVFKKPKACIYLIYQSDYSRQKPEALVSLGFYLKYFLISIAEHAYAAEQAGLRYRIELNEQGIHLKVQGFNDKLFKLLKLILNELIKFKIDPSLFDTIKQDFIRDYYNELISNDHLTDNVMNYLLNKNAQLLTEQREIVKKLDNQTIVDHLVNYFATAYCQCLIQGNYTKKEALDIFDYVKSASLSLKEEVNVDDIKREYVYQLPTGQHYCYIKSFNKADENILIVNNYQLGKFDEEQVVLLDLLNQKMFDPLFNLLRNEKTLAYCLYCRYRRTLNNVCSFFIVVKSLADKFTPKYVDEQIEWFIDHFLNEIVIKMSQSDFNELVEAKIKRKLVPFERLDKEADYYWNEICKFGYRFNRLKEEVEILKKLNKEQFIQFAKKILQKSDETRKLSLCSIGTGAKTEELFSTLNKPIDEDDDNDDKSDIVYSMIHMKPKEQENNCNLIESLDKFVNERVCY